LEGGAWWGNDIHEALLLKKLKHTRIKKNA